MGLRTALDSFGASLAQFSSSRLQNLKAQSTPLPDVPGEPFPDKALLYDSNFLMREGRTSAQQFRKTGAYDIWSDGEGTTFFAFPRTLCKYDSAAKTWNRVADEEVQPVPAGTAASLAKVFLSRTAASLQEALRSMGLGVDPLRDIEQLLRLLHKYVLVLVGDAATRHWKLERRLENPSTRKLCARSARTFAFTEPASMPTPLLFIWGISPWKPPSSQSAKKEIRCSRMPRFPFCCLQPRVRLRRAASLRRMMMPCCNMLRSPAFCEVCPCSNGHQLCCRSN